MHLATFPVATVLAFAIPAGASSILYSTSVNPSLFHETNFAGGLSAPQSILRMNDASMLIQTWTGTQSNLLRFTDANADGVADGPGASVYQVAPSGPMTQLTQAGPYIVNGVSSQNFKAGDITLLLPGANPGDSMTSVGSIHLSYPGNGSWYHPTLGFAARPTPSSPGDYDLVFNVGSEFNAAHSQHQVALSGLINASVDGDSLYMVTIHPNGSSPTVSNLRKIATGTAMCSAWRSSRARATFTSPTTASTPRIRFTTFLRRLTS
jgi:hypothetical protein